MRHLTIVGLGNPGPAFEWSRHNAGYMILDLVAARQSSQFTYQPSLLADVAEFSHAGATVRMLKPQTGMNESGLAVAAAMAGEPLESLLLVYDDIAIDLGRLKYQFDASAGGHRGVEHIHKALDSRQFSRLKLGLGPSPRQDIYNFVTAPVALELREPYGRCVAAAATSILTWIELGVHQSMNRFNGSKLLA